MSQTTQAAVEVVGRVTVGRRTGWVHGTRGGVAGLSEPCTETVEALALAAWAQGSRDVRTIPAVPGVGVGDYVYHLTASPTEARMGLSGVSDGAAVAGDTMGVSGGPGLLYRVAAASPRGLRLEWAHDETTEVAGVAVDDLDAVAAVCRMAAGFSR
jgi:hypothetical protein